MNLLVISLMTSLWIIGLEYLSYYELDPKGNVSEKEPLWWMRYYPIKWLGQTWSKPLISCAYCMSSLHTILMQSLLTNNLNPISCVVGMVITLGIVRILKKIIEF